MEILFQKIIKIGVFLILITPLIMGQFGLTLSAYPKAVFFRSLVEIMLLFYIFLLLLNPKKYIPKINLLIGAVFINIAVMLITSIAGINFYRSLWGDPERAEGLILHIHLLVFFIIIISIFNKKKDWLFLFKTAIVISGISSIAGVMQKLGMHNFYGVSLPQRISGTLSNPDFFAPYIVSSIFITFFVIAAENKKNFKYLWYAILFLNFSALIMSGTRGALAGMACGLAVLLPISFFYYKNLDDKKRIAVLFGVMLFLAVVMAAVLFPEALHLRGNYYFETFFSIFELNLGSRGDVWNLTWEAFKDRPLLGWGTESYSYVYDKYYNSQLLRHIPESIYFDHPHNKLLEIIVCNGIIGLLSYLYIYAIAAYIIFKNKKIEKKYKWIFISFFVSYFFQNLFFFDAICNLIFFYLVLGYINNNFFEDKIKNDKKEIKVPGIIKIAISAMSAVFIILVLYHLNMKPTQIASQFPYYVKFENSDIERAYLGYKNAAEKDNIYKKDFRLIFIERTLFLLENNKAGKIEEKIIHDYKELLPVFINDLKNSDRRVINSYEYLARIHQRIFLHSNDFKALDNMEIALNQALGFNNNVTVYYQLMGEMNFLRDKHEQGFENYNRMYNISPKRIEDIALYYKKIGVGYLKSKDEDKGIEFLEKAIESDYYYIKYAIYPVLEDGASLADTVAIMYYIDYNDIDSARKIYEKAIEVYPNHYKLLKYHLDAINHDYKIKNADF